jgi:mono/diheme cytochrome c family protein
MSTRKKVQTVMLLGCAGLMLASCRGNRTGAAPIHLQQNMDHQKRFEAQEANPFFKDGRGMRPPVKGTIARGELKANTAYYTGKVRGKLVSRVPGRAFREAGRHFGLDRRANSYQRLAALIDRGKARFSVYCAHCHGLTGNGDSIMVTRNIKVRPTSYMEPRLQTVPLGHFFDVITNGVRNMPSLAAQIPPADRWAIAAYVRVLQVAGTRSLNDVPADAARKNGWRKQ